MQPAFLREAEVEASERLDLDDFLPHRLAMSSQAVSALVSRAYRDRFGLTAPQWRAMSLLAEHGAQTLGALSNRAKMDREPMARAMQELTWRGLAAADAGQVQALTASGERLYAEIAPLARAYEAALIASLAPHEVRLLKRLLLRLQGAAASLAGDGEAATWVERD